MTVLILLVIALAVGIVYFMMKNGNIQDANNNNIPDKLEPIVEEVKEVVEVVKNATKAKKKTATKATPKKSAKKAK